MPRTKPRLRTGSACAALTLLFAASVTQAQNTFPDAAHVAPGVSPCPDDFTQVEGCYNLELPPRPSIERSAVRPIRPNTDDSSAADTQRTKAFSARAQVAGQTYTLPPHRTTLDGRIASFAPRWGRRSVIALSPENLGYGLQTHADLERQVGSRTSALDWYTQFDPRPGQSRIPADSLLAGEIQKRGEFWDFCSGAGPQATDSPRTCTALIEASDTPTEGDCYDQTVIWSNSTPDYKYDLRSLDLVLFVPHAKTVRSVSDDFSTGSIKRILVYPKIAVTDPVHLPPFAGLGYHDNVAAAASPPSYKYPHFQEQVLLHCPVGGGGPEWCAFIDGQRALLDEPYRFFTAPGTWHEYHGHGSPHAFLEPATTADGRVLIIHDDTQGIMYSYNGTHSPCDVRGFRDFKPISMAYLDPEVNTRYGFARYPIRNTRGETYAPGESVDGGYPWIDRKGSNLIFPAGGGQDGYKGTWLDDGTEITIAQVNRKNGRSPVVVGAWTRGKMVAVDNGLNPSDWRFSRDDLLERTFSVPLYADGEKWIRPAGLNLVNSIENQLNHYEALSPILPFDVVWIVSSSTQRNAEIAFDEYLNPRAQIVAHMNAPLTSGIRNTGLPENDPDNFKEAFWDDNGFASTTDNGYNMAFSGTPRLQNAATAHGVPAKLDLLGGAVLNPVAEGGVLGKGVFLDGRNDHIRADGVKDLSSFYVSLWVDLRPFPGQKRLDPNERALLTFADGSVLTLRDTYLRARTGPSPLGSDTRGISLPGLAKERFSHLGFAIYDDEHGRRIRVFLDGTYRTTMLLFSGFRTRVAPDWSDVDTTNPCGNAPNGQWTCSQDESFAAMCHEGIAVTSSACFLQGQTCNGEPLGAATLIGGSPCVAPLQPPAFPLPRDFLVVGRPVEAHYAYPPIRGWVDELRLYRLLPGEAVAPHFQELACNHALGSMRRIETAKGPRLVCEQLDFRHDEEIDAAGVGTGLDLPVQAYQTRNCASTVHGNAPADCVRGELLGVADRQLVATEVRPSFAHLPFCQTCHHSPNDPIEGLQPDKLLSGHPVLAKDDPRRQPLQWPALQPGGIPELDGQLVQPFDVNWWSRELDLVILGADFDQPPTKIPPQP